MPNEIETSLRNAAETISKYIADVATLTVETRYVEVGNAGAVNLDQAQPAARTVIRLDADSAEVVPMQRTEKGNLEVDATLLDIHNRNVAAAIEYRAKMLASLLTLLQGRIK